MIVVERSDAGLADVLDFLAVLDQSHAILVGLALFAASGAGDRGQVLGHGLAVGGSTLGGGQRGKVTAS